MSHLFLPPHRRDELNTLLEQGNRTARAMYDALTDPQWMYDKSKDTLLQQLVKAWWDGDGNAAEETGRALLEVHRPSPHSDLGKGADLLTLSLGLDFGYDLWSDTTRKAMVDLTASRTRSITDITDGNPHIVTNNWYMITHGGCLLGCLAAHGREGSAGAVDLADLEPWALGRFRAFCGHFGNAGLYHEGTGYIAYTLSILMPTLVALKRRRGLDLTEEFPNLRLSIRSMLTGTVRTPAKQDGTEARHIMLDWNDTGRDAARLNPLVPGLVMSRKEDQPALRTFLERTLGVDGMNFWLCAYRGLPLSVALYPFDLEPEEPGERLPRHVFDTQQGLGFWRDQWGDGTESLFGWYARSTHASPGHAHEDAGSIRLISQGRSWICGAGQARPKAPWQSVITPAQEEDRPDTNPYAYVFSKHLGDTKGQVGMEMRQVLQAYSERYLSWRTDLGFPFALAMLDLVDEHHTPPRPFTWNLTFPQDLSPTLTEDGKGFTLGDPECGTLVGRFLLDAPDTLTVEQIPESTRTYSSGKKEIYPGDFYLQGRFENRSALRILVALAIVPPDGDTSAPVFENGEILFGDSIRWAHPFDGLILPSVNLATDPPNLQKFPAGTP